MSDLKPLVAVFNSSRDTVEMLEVAFQLEGFRTASGHVADVRDDVLDLEAFFARFDPRAVVWDIAPPYERNWRFFEELLAKGAFTGRALVLTTTHLGHLDVVAGHHTHAIEILGKPYDINRVVESVRVGLAVGEP